MGGQNFIFCSSTLQGKFLNPNPVRMKKKYNFLWIVLLSVLCFSQYGLQAQNVCSDCQTEVKMVSDKQVLLETIDIPEGSQMSKMSTNIYVSYHSGDTQKFWANLAIATAGVVVSTQLHNASTGEGQEQHKQCFAHSTFGFECGNFAKYLEKSPT